MLFTFMIGGVANMAANGMSGILKAPANPLVRGLSKSASSVAQRLAAQLMQQSTRAIIGYAVLEEYMSKIFEEFFDFFWR